MVAISEQIDIALRMCVPYVVMFVLVLLNVIFSSTPLSSTINVPFVLMVLYYWSSYRPGIVPPLLVFITGLCLDFLSGFPVGLSSFILLVMRHIVSEQRLFLTGQPFMVIWLGYMIVSGVALVAQWALFGLIHLNWTPIQPVVLEFVAGTFLFPVIALILNLSHKVLPFVPDQYSAVK